MKWVTHQLGACAAGFSPLAIGAAFVGAVIPDVIDQKICRLGMTAKRRQKIFNRVHSGSSHWFGWWLALFLPPFAFFPALPGLELVSGFAFGAMSHVALDALTTRGVPLLPIGSKTRVSLKICSTGSLGEILFALAMTLGAVSWRAADVKDALLYLAALL